MRERDTIHHRGGGRKKGDDIHVTPDVSYITNPDVEHEHSDVSVGPIAKFVIGLFIFGVVVHVLMWVLFMYFDKREKAVEPPASPLARRDAERLPPEPRLQLAPGFGINLDNGQRVDLSQRAAKPEWRIPQAEWKVLREEWEQELTTYDWVDQNAGTVRLPIKDAMRLLVQREQQKAQGQPAAPSSQQQQQQSPNAQGNAASGENVPSPSSSGRQAEKRNQ